MYRIYDIVARYPATAEIGHRGEFTDIERYITVVATDIDRVSSRGVVYHNRL